MITVSDKKPTAGAQAAVQNGPIFIIGAPRSGTTLLQYMLRSHPRISLPTGESHFIVPLYKKAESFGDLRNQDNIRLVLDEMYRRNASFLDTDLHGMEFRPEVLAQQLHAQGVTTIPQLIRAMMELNAKGESKQRWGDKTPYYSLHVPLIMKMFPDAQILHIIRDGRDCALSMLGRRYDLDIHNVHEAARIWRKYVAAGQEAGQRLGKNMYHEIYYENLLNDKAGVVKGVCDFLGEDFSDSVIEFNKPSSKGKTPLLSKSIQSDNIEKWKAQMTRWQLRVFEAVAGDTLASNGYDLAAGENQFQTWINFPYRLHQRYYSRLVNKVRRKKEAT